MSDQPTTITSVEDLLDFCDNEPAGCASIHIDDNGAFTCGTNATNLDSLEQWATNPTRIVNAASSIDTCGRRWIIFVRQDSPPTEHDASHYLDIRAALACGDVDLVDCVIAWDDQHVSMRYLQHRTTRYPTPGHTNAA